MKKINFDRYGYCLLNLWKNVEKVLFALLYSSLIYKLLFRKTVDWYIFSSKWHTYYIVFHICDVQTVWKFFSRYLYCSIVLVGMWGIIYFYHNFLSLCLLLWLVCFGKLGVLVVM